MIARALALVCALATVASADEKLNAAAKEHNDAALAAYKAQHYADAAKEFEAAYLADPRPSLLWGWAQSERLDGHCDRALPLYNKYLYADVTKRSLEAARANIKQCEQQASNAPPPPPPPPPPQVMASTWYSDPLADAVTVTGVAGMVAGVVFLAKSSGTGDAAMKAQTLDGYYAGLSEATSQRKIGYASLGIGAAVTAAGVFLLVRQGREHRGPLVASDGHSILVGARF